MIWRCVTSAALALSLVACADHRSAAVGKRLFMGELALTARIAGNDLPLPADGSRCTNCHDGNNAAAGSGTPAFAPPLAASTLLTERKRRGGPPTRYSLESFCSLLRTGIDPASVLVARAMPRYDLDTEKCRALWNYIKARS